MSWYLVVLRAPTSSSSLLTSSFVPSGVCIRIRWGKRGQGDSRRRVDVGIFLESVRDRESMAFCGLTEKWPSENGSLDQDFFETGKAEWKWIVGEEINWVGVQMREMNWENLEINWEIKWVGIELRERQEGRWRMWPIRPPPLVNVLTLKPFS